MASARMQAMSGHRARSTADADDRGAMNHVCEDCCPERFAGCYCTLLDENERLRGALSEIIAEGYDGNFAVETARNALGPTATEQTEER